VYIKISGEPSALKSHLLCADTALIDIHAQGGPRFDLTPHPLCHPLYSSPKDYGVTLRELRDLLNPLPDDAEVVVSLFQTDGTVQAFPIDGVNEEFGIIHIEVSEEEGLIY